MAARIHIYCFLILRKEWKISIEHIVWSGSIWSGMDNEIRVNCERNYTRDYKNVKRYRDK